MAALGAKLQAVIEAARPVGRVTMTASVSLRSIRTVPRCIRRSGRTALYWVHTPMNRSDVIDPETKSRGATPS